MPEQRQRSLGWTLKSSENSNFYIFGGFKFYEHMNDFWKYDSSEGKFELVGKGENKLGIYGEKGVPSADNWPGARESSVTWTDSKGLLWLFGGRGYGVNDTLGYLNDLWKFDGKLWTWVSGDKGVNTNSMVIEPRVYNPLHKPGSRALATGWINSKDEVFIFGGSGYAVDPAPMEKILGDVWQYDSINNMWRLVGGSPFSEYFPAVYGERNTPNPMNFPGSRKRSCGFVDTEDNLWLFSGKRQPQNSFELLNDLWKFSNGSWIWVSGDSTADEPGVYGDKNVPGEKNKPGSRENAFCYCDSNNRIWTFGGNGKSKELSGKLNDFWLYDMTIDQWTWTGGTDKENDIGSFGTRRQAGGIPSSRESGNHFLDHENNFWIFGGYGFDAENEGNLGDLWKGINPGIPKEPFRMTNELWILLIIMLTFVIFLSSLCVFGVSFMTLKKFEVSSSSIQDDGHGYFQNLEE
eukprot:gene3698-6512_t